jgi:gliding motility-associated-like protein
VQFKCLSGSPDSLYWDFDDGTTSTLLNPSHTFSTPRKYNVKLFVKNCFNTDTIVKEVTIFPPPQIRILGPPKMCQGQSVQLVASGGISYFWKSDSTLSDTSVFNPIARPPVTQKYYVSGIDSNGCRSKDSIQIIVFNSLNPILETDTSICAGDSLRLWANQDTALISKWTWESKKLGILDSNNYPMVSPSTTDTFYFRYTTIDGCNLVDSVIVKIFFSVIANAGVDVFGCKDEKITLKASGGTNFFWSNGQNSPVISVSINDSLKWYSVIVSQGKCRSLPDSVAVFRTDVHAEFEVSLDTGYAPQEIVFTNKSSLNSVLFDWDFGDGNRLQNVANPKHIYQKEGVYSPTLTVQSLSPSCLDTFQYQFIFIDSVKLVIPNAFSPNNDGINENLVFEGFNLSMIDVLIFDRWGQEIFQGKGERVTWDGKVNGQLCTVGAYPYLVNAIGKNGKTYRWQGLVTLVR